MRAKPKRQSADARFQSAYQESLKQCLGLAPKGAANAARSPRELGLQAVADKLSVAELLSLHFQTLESIEREAPPSQRRSDSAKAAKRRAYELLCGVVAQLEKAQENALAAKENALNELEQETRRYNELLEQAHFNQGQARTLAHQFLLAQEEERKEISRELHDQVAQLLAGINVRLAGLKGASKVDLANLSKRISQTQVLVEQSVELVHSYARRLRPAMLDDLGLIPSLRSFIKELPGCKGLTISLTTYPQVDLLDNKSRTILYRVAQESLTNIARHAQAKQVKVVIRKRLNNVHLEIWDDGKSFDTNRILSSNTRNRLGLIGMRERVEMVGGTFSIESKPGTGTTVKASIPIATRQPE